MNASNGASATDASAPGAESPGSSPSSNQDSGRRGADEADKAGTIELEPGTRAARLYELLAVDLWWSLGMMGAAGVIATILFILTALGPLRAAGIAVGLGTAIVYAGRLIWLRGVTGTQADEWAVIMVEAAVLIALTETTAVILEIVGGGLL